MKYYLLPVALFTALFSSMSVVAQTSVTPWYNGNPVSASNPLPVSGGPVADVLQFGAKCDGSTDDGPALRALLTNPAYQYWTIMLPPNATCVVGQDGSNPWALRQTVPMSLLGNGFYSKLVGTAGLANTVNILYIAVNSTYTWAFIRYQDFSINGTTGFNAIYLDTTAVGANFYHNKFTGMAVVGNHSGFAFYHNNNPANNPNGGLFLTEFNGDSLFGGMSLNESGDSILIHNTAVTGPNQIYVNQVSGAGDFVVDGASSISTAGGVLFDCAVAPIIRDSELEQQVTNTEANNALIDLNGGVCAIDKAVISSQVQANPSTGNPTLVRIAAATNTTLDNARFATPANYVAVVDNGAGTVFGPNLEIATSSPYVSGSDATRVDLSKGNILIPGTYTQAYSDTALSGVPIDNLITITTNPASNSAASFVGSRTTLQTTANSLNYTGTLQAFAPFALHQGTGTIATLWGGNILARNGSTGTVTALDGLHNNADNSFGGTVTMAIGGDNFVSNNNAGSSMITGIGVRSTVNNAGTLTTGYNFQAAAPSGVSAIGTLYGFYNAAKLNVTANYGFYDADTAATDQFLGGVVVGSPTGGNKGAGTLNVAGCFVNGVACLTTADGSVNAFTFSTPATGNTVTMTTPQTTPIETAIIKPAGTLATLTVTLPACNAAADGYFAKFSTTQVITALTVNAAAGSVADAPGSLAVGGGNEYMCRGADTTWYRTQ